MINHPNRKKKAVSSASAGQAATSAVQSIKGMDVKMQCRGFQFEIGKSYEVSGIISACSQGFHACPIDAHPLSVFELYRPAKSRFFEVTQEGASDRDGTKLASAKITIGVEITLNELIQRAVKWVFDRANWKDGPVAIGANEGVTASGYSGAATASGNYGAATASGNYGAATASGTYGAATASGNSGAATASGYYGAATASGYSGKAKGADGCALFLLERDNDWKIVAAWAGIVGRNGIKADTFYRLVKGEPVEA